MLPEAVELGAGQVIAVAAERAEALAGWPTDDHVGVRVLLGQLDVIGKHFATEVPLERGRGGNLVLDGEDRLETLVTEGCQRC